MKAEGWGEKVTHLGRDLEDEEIVSESWKTHESDGEALYVPRLTLSTLYAVQL